MAANIAPGQAVLVRHQIVADGQVAFTPGERVVVEAIKPNQERPTYKFVVYSKNLDKRLQLCEDDIYVSAGQELEATRGARGLPDINLQATPLGVEPAVCTHRYYPADDGAYVCRDCGSRFVPKNPKRDARTEENDTSQGLDSDGLLTSDGYESVASPTDDSVNVAPQKSVYQLSSPHMSWTAKLRGVYSTEDIPNKRDMAIGYLVGALVLIICLVIVGVTTSRNSSDKVDFVLDSNSSPPDISGSYEKTTSGGQLEYQMQVYDDGTYGESHSLKGRPYTRVYAYVYYVEAGTGVYYSATENRLFRIIGRVSDHYFTSYEIDDNRLVPRDFSSYPKSECSVHYYVIDNGDLIYRGGLWEKQ